MQMIRSINAHQASRLLEIENTIRAAVVRAKGEGSTIKTALGLAIDYLDALDEAQGGLTAYELEDLRNAVQEIWEQKTVVT